MHGLIFVTWEKYLQERFEGAVLSEYRQQLGLNATNSPLAVRTYDDALLLKGVGVAHEITKMPVDTLLREYGRYFIVNGLILAEIQEQFQQRGASKQQSRPALILQALTQLHHAGLVASSANEPGDDFARRRYWRVPVFHGHN